MPRKMKIEAGEIAELVRQHLAAEIGVNEAGRQAGVDKKTMRRWIARYESEGIDGLLPQRKNRVYSLELKVRGSAKLFSRRWKSSGYLQKVQDQTRIHTSAVDKGVYCSWRL